MKRSTSASLICGTALVDLGLLARGRVDHRRGWCATRRRPRMKSLRIRSSASSSMIRGAGRAAGEPGRDHGLAEQLQRAGDVDALAAGDGSRLDRAVAVAERGCRDRDGAVDRGVEGDREDHLVSPVPVRVGSLAASHALLRALAPSTRRARCRSSERGSEQYDDRDGDDARHHARARRSGRRQVASAIARAATQRDRADQLAVEGDGRRAEPLARARSAPRPRGRVDGRRPAPDPRGRRPAARASPSSASGSSS